MVEPAGRWMIAWACGQAGGRAGERESGAAGVTTTAVTRRAKFADRGSLILSYFTKLFQPLHRKSVSTLMVVPDVHNIDIKWYWKVPINIDIKWYWKSTPILISSVPEVHINIDIKQVIPEVRINFDVKW